MSKIYSPSQSTNFLTCPMLWRLSKDGWLPKTYGKSNLYAIRGSSVSEGLEAFYKGTDPIDAVDLCVSREWASAKIDEREWSSFKGVPFTRSEITQQAQLLVKTYIENPPVAFRVLHSEYVFKGHGYARADVIAETIPGKKIIPVDFKCKDTPIQNFYRFTIKEDYRFSWQMFFYAWAVSEEFQVNCLEFGIVVLWHDKKCRIEYVPFIINPERLTNWYLSAREVWARMEACESGLSMVTEAAEHKTKFGPCPFSQACLLDNRDEDKMYRNYFKVERRR